MFLATKGLMKDKITETKPIHVQELGKNESPERLSFLTHISHGIRTPLNAIMGYSKLMVLKNMGDIKMREYINGILRGSSLLLQFVDNIVDLSQFETENYQVRIVKCDINQAIWEYIEDFYFRKAENNDSTFNLSIVCDKQNTELFIETDLSLFKKSMERLINLIVAQCNAENFEIGYNKIDKEYIRFFVRPSLKFNLNEDYRNISLNNIISFEEDSFQFFNYQVLSLSVQKLGGELDRIDNGNELAFIIPITLKSI